MKTHDYKVINVSLHKSVEDAANAWAEKGWRVVGVVPMAGPGYSNQLVVERPVGVAHPDD